MADIAEVLFDGQRYDFWESVNIRSSVDDLCAAVELEVARPGEARSFPITANTVAGVAINGRLVTTVRSDVSVRDISSKAHQIAFQARSLGRELVDCQYSTTLSGLRLGEVVKRICALFKVPVKIDAETPVVPSFSMQCEQPANALINAVRASNMLLYPTADGGLILTKPSAAAPVATLQYGVNIEHYRITDEHRMRFSEYVIKGYDYASNQALSGRVKDDGLSFFRPMHIVADRLSHGLGGCERSATLERNRRLARAHRIDIDTTGWEYIDASGARQPWRINEQVRVVIDNGDDQVDGVFLIGDVRMLQSGSGTRTVLTVMHRNAFAGEQPNKRTKRAAGVR